MKHKKIQNDKLQIAKIQMLQKTNAIPVTSISNTRNFGLLNMDLGLGFVFLIGIGIKDSNWGGAQGLGIGIKDWDIENEVNSISLGRGKAAGPLQVETRRLNHYQILLFVSRCTGQSETTFRVLGVVEEERQAHKVMPSKALLSTIVVSWGGSWFLTEYILNPSFD